MTPQQQKAIITRLVHSQLISERVEINRRAITAVITAVAVSLHDKYDWKPDEINKLVKLTVNEFEAINEKYLTLDELLQMAEDMGIVM